MVHLATQPCPSAKEIMGERKMARCTTIFPYISEAVLIRPRRTESTELGPPSQLIVRDMGWYISSPITIPIAKTREEK